MINSIYKYDRESLKDKKVVIYGIMKPSQYLAMRLVQENISFEGFLSPIEHNELQCLLNKRVYHVKEVKDDNENIAILVPYVLKQEAADFVEKHPELKECISLETIKEKVINAETIIVYGCGERAELLEKNVPDLNICCYFNSDKEKEGNIHKGRVIHHPSVLQNVKGSYAVIIASTYYIDMHKTLLEYGCNEEAIFIDLMDIIINEYKVSQIRIEHIVFCQLIKELYQKKVILYGERNTVNRVESIFGYIGITFSNVIRRDSISEDGTIYDIFYQNSDEMDRILLTDKPNSLQYEILVNMNYTEKQILYVGARLYSSYRRNLLHIGLDPVLGYSKFSEEKKSLLFIKHRWFSEDDAKGIGNGAPVRIAVLGGSTTDENAVKNKSWPEYLCEYLRNHNISYELYNGGMFGYNASQELLKLIRDVVQLKPDICISYSGVNNTFQNTQWSEVQCVEKFPFIHKYQKAIYDSLDLHIDIFGSEEKGAKCMELGMEYSGDWDDFWISQIRMQKAICEEFSIKYVSVLQPNFFTKKCFMERDQELLAWNNMCIENGTLKFFDDVFSKLWDENKEFQTNISDKIKNIDYIYDMRSIFDDIDDVYIDILHVCSLGNKIIAKKIYEVLEHGHYLEGR